MSIVVAIVRRLSVTLMLIAIVALVLQAGGASAYAFGDTGDCPNDVHIARSIGHGGEALPIEQDDDGHVHKSPCRSACCCHAACSMAVLADVSTVQMPALIASGIAASVVRSIEGIDIKGLIRPPRAPISV